MFIQRQNSILMTNISKQNKPSMIPNFNWKTNDFILKLNKKKRTRSISRSCYQQISLFDEQHGHDRSNMKILFTRI